MDRIKNNWLFIMGSLIFLVAGIMVYNLTSDFIRRHEVVNSTAYYYEELEDMRINFRRAVIEQRDYLLSGKKEYLEYYFIYQEKTIENINKMCSSNYLENEEKYNVNDLRQNLVRYFHMMDSIVLMDYDFGYNEIGVFIEESNRFYDNITKSGERIELQLEEKLFGQLDIFEQNARDVRLFFTSSILVAFLLLSLNYIMLQKEIKRKKKAEEKIKKQARELQELIINKDKFFSIIAHDLRAPFNYLLGFSKVLKNKVSERTLDEIEKISGIIHDATKNTFDLLQNLLNWAQIQTGTLELKPEKFDLAEVANETMELFHNFSADKDIELRNEIEIGSFTYSDKNIISTVMRNLVNNAIKFTSPGGKVYVKSVKSENQWVVSVLDTGVGIKPGNLDKIFRMDMKISTVGTGNEKGSGLGLLLSKELVEKNGGKIWVESEPGKGTEFYFTVPFVKDKV